MIDLLRRAWDTLDTFKQAYPENWNEQDEQVLKDLLKADLKLSGVKLKWQGLTEDELWDLWNSYIEEPFPEWFVDFEQAYKIIEAKLKEKNT